MAGRSHVLQMSAKVSPSRLYTPPRKSIFRNSSIYSKSLMFGKDDPLNSPRYTIFTLPGATKRSVLDAVNARMRTWLPLDNLGTEDRAAVILTNPRYATWLTDPDFMTTLVYALRPKRDSNQIPTIHVLAAVVDGLCPRYPNREMQEGFSIQLGKMPTLLPGLWDETNMVPKSLESNHKPSHLSLFFNRTARGQDTLSVTLPLANTLFQTGRRSTLLASEWTANGPASDSVRSPMRLLRMAEKRTQSVDLSLIDDRQNFLVRCPLVPITRPRMIIEGLGNILAKVDIEGEPSPASKELQVNIPQWIQARQSQPNSDHAPGPVGVWALVIPGQLITKHDSNIGSALPETVKEALFDFGIKMKSNRLGTAIDKLAFEMTHQERMAWQMTPVLRDILSNGAHIHKILSGGGEWGAKASLLSLDPKTSYGPQSEEDELIKFQRSFHGDRNAEGAIARPGDFVQFFVERDPEPVSKPAKQRNRTSMIAGDIPPVSFGVDYLSANIHDRNLTAEKDPESRYDEIGQTYLAKDHFGGLTAEALYLSSDSNFNTKLDTPGATVGLIGLAPYHPVVRRPSFEAARTPLGGGLNPT